MSFFQRVFGKKTAKGPTLPEAIIQLKTTEQILLKKQTYLEEKIKKEIATAKKNASSNKKVALQALQKKKRLERQLQNVDCALTTLEMQRDVLENASTNRLALKSMEDALKAMKKTHKNIDVNEVEKILENVAEERDIADDIADALSHPVGFNDSNLDEDELEKELEELIGGAEELSVNKLLPPVPQDDLPKAEKGTHQKEQKDLATS